MQRQSVLEVQGGTTVKRPAPQIDHPPQQLVAHGDHHGVCHRNARHTRAEGRVSNPRQWRSCGIGPDGNARRRGCLRRPATRHVTTAPSGGAPDGKRTSTTVPRTAVHLSHTRLADAPSESPSSLRRCQENRRTELVPFQTATRSNGTSSVLLRSSLWRWAALPTAVAALRRPLCKSAHIGLPGSQGVRVLLLSSDSPLIADWPA